MSLHRMEKEKENAFDDSRRVSFSLPRSKKLDKMNESCEEDSDSLSEVEPPPVQILPHVQVKPKKKWKIKLPWKQKKQLAYYDSPEDEITEKNDEIDLVDELKKLDSLDKEDKFNDSKNASPSPSASPLTRKEDRPLTWYGGFQMAGPSAESSLENRANSIQMPKDETKSDTEKDVLSIQTTVAEFHADHVDFVSEPTSLNINKKQKAKPIKFRLNFKAFNQKTYTYDNSNIKIREEAEKDLSSTEASSPDIGNSPLSEVHLSKSNSSLIDNDDQKEDKFKSDEKLSERKSPEDHFIKSRLGTINTTEYHKKSGSLPRIFKKYKKKKETDFKTSQLRKYHHENWDKKSSDSSMADFRNEKSNAAEDVLPSISDSELHIKEYQRERSGSQPNVHSSKRRTQKSIFKMSRSSFIVNANTGKSSDLLNRSMSSDNNNRQEIVPKTNDQNSRSLDDLDIQSETNSDLQLKSSFSRNYRAKNSQRNTFSNLSTSDLGCNDSDKHTVSKEKDFDKNFKSDYAIKMNQVSIRNQKSPPIINPRRQRHKSPDFLKSDVASPEILKKGVISQKKLSDDHSLKVDDFTNFIKSYSTNKSAKQAHVSKKEKSENLSDRNADAQEFIEKETVLLKIDGDQPFKTVGNSTKPRKKLKSSSKTKPLKNDPRNNSSEHSSSETGVHDHSDKDKKIRTVKTSETLVEPNEFTEFIKNYNSSKSSKILTKSHKHHQHKKNVGKGPLNSNINNHEASKKTREEIIGKPSSGIISKIDFPNSDSSDEGHVSLTEFRDNKNSFLKEKSNKKGDHFTDFALITNSGKNVKNEQSVKEIKSFADNSNSLSVPISDKIVRRRSYEEMTNLLEEQMFASDSEEASSNTDSDEVDLSFGRKKVDPKLKEEDFKLCVVTEQGSFSGTELVYEPNILPKKESSLPFSNSEIINTSPILKRPSDAPPLPPLPSQITGKENMTNVNSLETKLSEEDSLTKSDNEITKRKKLRKILTTRSMSNSTDSDTSIEDANGTLYASFSSKLDYKRENSLKKEHNLLSILAEKAHTNIISDIDDYCPPIFTPSVHYSDNKKISQIFDANEKYPVNEGLAETVHNKLGSTSATCVANSLYTRREDKNNSLFNLSGANVVDAHIKGQKSLRPLMKPPSPPSSPPPDDLFTPDPIPIGGSYNLKNFSPMYEYAPNMPSLGLPVNNKHQPISCYSSSSRDEINATNENTWKEEDKFDSFDNIEKNSHSFHKREVNPDFKYVQNQFSNNMHKICNEKSNLESSSSFVPESLPSESIDDMKNIYLEDCNKISQSTSFQNDINTSKKHIVTFSFPYPTNTHPNYKTSSNSATSYRDISYGEKNNQITFNQNDKISYHSLPNNLQAYRVNGMPKSSLMIQHRLLSTKEGVPRVSQAEEGTREDLLKLSQPEEGMRRITQTDEGRSFPDYESNMSHEERFHPAKQKINSNPYQAFDSNTYPHGIDRSHERTYPHGIERSHGRYIHVSSPIPYSKEGRQLKSILKSNNRNNVIGHSTQPSLLQTNVKYIQPVSGEVKSSVYRTIPKQLIPSTATSTTAFNPAIERVKIMEETSSSESEISPPALPSYPPPLPRQTWHHQQQFLGGLLHSDRDRSSFAVQEQQPPLHSSYYTPTIIEVEAHHGRMLDRESVYQNVIHASQV